MVLQLLTLLADCKHCLTGDRVWRNRDWHLQAVVAAGQCSSPFSTCLQSHSTLPFMYCSACTAHSRIAIGSMPCQLPLTCYAVSTFLNPLGGPLSTACNYCGFTTSPLTKMIPWLGLMASLTCFAYSIVAYYGVESMGINCHSCLTHGALYLHSLCLVIQDTTVLYCTKQS